MVHVTQFVAAWQGCRAVTSLWPSLTILPAGHALLLLSRRWTPGLPPAWQLRLQFSRCWVAMEPLLSRWFLSGCRNFLPGPLARDLFIYSLLNFLHFLDFPGDSFCTNPAWDTGKRICLHHDFKPALHIPVPTCPFFQPSLSG